MTQALRNAAIVLLAFAAGACVQVGHIQQTKPVRTLKFTGSHKFVAQCVAQRLGGKVHDDSFGERYVIYNAVKGKQTEGLTHYAITVGRTSANEGFAEWRIMRPARGPGPASARPEVPPLSSAAVEEYWTPVRDCAAQAKPAQ